MKKTNIILSLLCSVCLFSSCENTHTLIFNETESQIIDTFAIINKLCQKNYKDSIVISRYLGNKKYEDTYLKKDNKVYDIRKCGDLLSKQDTVLFFSIVDTVFYWNSKFSLMPYLIGRYKNSCITSISNISENLFKTTLIRHIDTTIMICNKEHMYREIYYYDKSFKIIRCEYYYKSSKVVLVPAAPPSRKFPNLPPLAQGAVIISNYFIKKLSPLAQVFYGIP